MISALHVWLDRYPEDFKEPPHHPALNQLLNFCQEHLPVTELEAKVRHRLERYSRDLMPDPILSSSITFAIRPKQIDYIPYNFPDTRYIRHFAEQLTRMDVVSQNSSLYQYCLI